MADFYLLMLGLLILLSSLISIRLGLSVSIIEILFDVIAGNLGIIRPESWMFFIASFGGILLVFLSGTEIDLSLMRKKLKETFLIGFLSFLIPFVLIFLVTYFLIGCNLLASLLAGTALSETSIAVVYSV